MQQKKKSTTSPYIFQEREDFYIENTRKNISTRSGNDINLDQINITPSVSATRTSGRRTKGLMSTRGRNLKYCFGDPSSLRSVGMTYSLKILFVINTYIITYNIFKTIIILAKKLSTLQQYFNFALKKIANFIFYTQKV